MSVLSISDRPGIFFTYKSQCGSDPFGVYRNFVEGRVFGACF